jgi:hypothetical protein
VGRFHRRCFTNPALRFRLTLGDATRTARLKSGAIFSATWLRPRRAEIFAPPGQERTDLRQLTGRPRNYTVLRQPRLSLQKRGRFSNLQNEPAPTAAAASPYPFPGSLFLVCFRPGLSVPPVCYWARGVPGSEFRASPALEVSRDWQVLLA